MAAALHSTYTIGERRVAIDRAWEGDADYAPGMKTVVSIPDDVFGQVERFARLTKRSMSEVVSAAIREYMSRHAEDEITDSINRALHDIDEQQDGFVTNAGRRVLEKIEWSRL